MSGVWLAVLIIALSVVTNWLQKVFAGLLGLAKSQTVLIESAEKAGLNHGDVILAVDSQPVKTRLQATELIRRSAGKTLPLLIKRGDNM